MAQAKRPDVCVKIETTNGSSVGVEFVKPKTVRSIRILANVDDEDPRLFTVQNFFDDGGSISFQYHRSVGNSLLESMVDMILQLDPHFSHHAARRLRRALRLSKSHGSTLSALLSSTILVKLSCCLLQCTLTMI